MVGKEHRDTPSGDEHSGSANRAAIAVAERILRKSDRFDPAGMS
jgi:hypothetical protein